MGQDKVRYSHPDIFLDGGGDSSDEPQGSLGFLGVQVALVLHYFADLHFLYDAINC